MLNAVDQKVRSPTSEAKDSNDRFYRYYVGDLIQIMFNAEK